MPHMALQQHYDLIEDSVTMAEVCRLWKKKSPTVRYAIDSGNIAAKQVGGIWIVSLSSVKWWWGDPPGEGTHRSN